MVEDIIMSLLFILEMILIVADSKLDNLGTLGALGGPVFNLIILFVCVRNIIKYNNIVYLNWGYPAKKTVEMDKSIWRWIFKGKEKIIIRLTKVLKLYEILFYVLFVVALCVIIIPSDIDSKFWIAIAGIVILVNIFTNILCRCEIYILRCKRLSKGNIKYILRHIFSEWGTDIFPVSYRCGKGRVDRSDRKGKYYQVTLEKSGKQIKKVINRSEQEIVIGKSYFIRCVEDVYYIVSR